MTSHPSIEDAYDRVVGALYEAAADPAGWATARRAMAALFGATDIGLYVRDGQGPGLTPLMTTPAPIQAQAYIQYYHRLDPFRADGEAAWRFVRSGRAARTKMGTEVIAERDFVRTEFYADYFRPLERGHMLGGMLGREVPAPISLFRPPGAVPFGEEERRLLERLLPHLQRALDLRERLDTVERASGAGYAALEALGTAIAVLTPTMHPVFLSTAGEAAIGMGGGLCVSASGGPLATSVLAPRHPRDAAVLQRLVVSAAAGGAGGTLRLQTTDLARPPIVLLVSPLPKRLGPGTHGGAMTGLALLVIRGAEAPPPAASLLATAFDLSAAEAEVASLLASGATLQDAARVRGVALETVRTQARSVLRKSGYANLRVFRRRAVNFGP